LSEQTRISFQWLFNIAIAIVAAVTLWLSLKPPLPNIQPLRATGTLHENKPPETKSGTSDIEVPKTDANPLEAKPQDSKVDIKQGTSADKSRPVLRPTVILSSTQAPTTKEELEAEAEVIVQQLLARMPDEARALHISALLNAQLHKTAEAERLWKKCIELAPKVEQYYVNLAATAVDRGDNQLAIDTLQAARSKGLDSTDIAHHLGMALMNAGRNEEAADVASKVVSQFPNLGGHWLILGQAKLKLGKTQEAEESLRKAIELGARTKAAYFALFNACNRLGKKEEGKKFREIYASFGEKELNVQERFQVLSEAEAKRIVISVLMETAALYRAANLMQDAEFKLLRVIALSPDDQAACKDLATIYSQQKRPADERVVRERMIKADPGNLLNYLLVARASAVCGDPDSAEAYIKLAISLAPKMETGYIAMSEFLMEQHQPKKATWYLQQALEIDPNPAGFQLLAKAWRAVGNEANAAAADAARQQLMQENKSLQKKP
jgi:tetratricopeptide (TPR) repeat protein